ncbi:MAG: anhydro-N-acetylmuramic acid kinase [Alphaproteobacteria bacterium]|nr:anhydro-N-acetylmuramic acid kinase [Alphaproteobacteria bacterium]
MSKPLTALGLMSGTSLDGIDVALVTTDGEDRVLRGPAQTFAYGPDRQALLQDALADARSIVHRDDRPGVLAEAERELTEWHADAVETFCRENGITHSEIDVIGFHGQTVLHRPEIALTVQIGDGTTLARRTACPVVYDMRAADMAAGGQGAPLVPVYHRALAASIDARPIAFVNIGGVANLTWIGRNGALIAFDTGPGNALLNDWCERHLDEAIDRDGALAARGVLDMEAFMHLATNPYFERPAPKSLDRNAFDVSVLNGLSPEDGAATLVHFTATSIARSVGHVPDRPVVYVICGGGRHNPTLLREIRSLLEPLGERVMTAEDGGWDGDAMEAEAWAYLAVRALKGLPLTFPGTTGVSQPLTGGRLARP